MKWQMTKWNEVDLNDWFFIPLHSPFLISFLNSSILQFLHFFYSLRAEWWHAKRDEVSSSAPLKNCSSSEAETKAPVGIVNPSAPLGVQISPPFIHCSSSEAETRTPMYIPLPRLCSASTQLSSKFRWVGTHNRNSKMIKNSGNNTYINSIVLNFKPIGHAWSNWGNYDDL